MRCLEKSKKKKLFVKQKKVVTIEIALVMQNKTLAPQIRLPSIKSDR